MLFDVSFPGHVVSLQRTVIISQVINWRKELQIPSAARLRPEASDLIKRLCCDPPERLGSRGTDEVKAHPFFQGIDWVNLRKQDASYVPVIRYPTDISNFDPVDPDKIPPEEEVEEEEEEITGSVIVRDKMMENGKQPDHAFYEFTFRRFFDEGGNWILQYDGHQSYDECDTSSENSMSTKEEDSSPVYVWQGARDKHSSCWMPGRTYAQPLPQHNSNTGETP